VPATPPVGPIVLVAMPFLHADRPSIPLGLLKAVAGARGHEVRTVHACLDFAVRIRAPHGIWGGLNEVERKQLSAGRAG